jgi:hypothetical protein
MSSGAESLTDSQLLEPHTSTPLQVCWVIGQVPADLPTHSTHTGQNLMGAEEHE